MSNYQENTKLREKIASLAAAYNPNRKAMDETETETVARLRKGLGGMVRTLAKVVELRDPFKQSHHQLVANLSRAIADQMGLDPMQVEHLRFAASIHDVGKVYVPTEILNKPDRVTDSEYSLIKTHPGIAHNLLEKAEFPGVVADIVLQHHERMDGSGYPFGLKHDEIMIEARILGLADMIEAMISVRPYRQAMPIKQVLEEISKMSGVTFDSKVVDACLELFKTQKLDDLATD